MLVSLLYAHSFADTHSFIYRAARKGKHATMLEKTQKVFASCFKCFKISVVYQYIFSVFHNNNNRDNKSLKLLDRGYLDSRFIDGVVALYVLTMDRVPGWSR